MGASVGIGGLIVGISMLVVFSMAYQSITSQIDSGLERLDDADEPIPTFTIDDAILFDGAVVDSTIATAGTGYTNGTLASSTGGGGFAGEYTVDGSGAIVDVVITSHGDYATAPTLTITCATPCTGNSGTGSVVPTLGNAVYANFTNTGSSTIQFDDMWLFTNGTNPVPFDTAYTSSISSTNWFTGETLFLQWIDTGTIGHDRISMTVGPTTVGHNLA
ncbi:MAG: hypothetical protein ISP83_04360 [Candidatus Poseidonia sp.]|nr:hypothetical protein [Poseidonia sp.]MBL6747831.1 hypothetical protein [Poseidonia sp.]MBL6806754.1 hypothetical protein [Poseidonia sp.]MBL6886246.1 hypothetical protein [Poseidonia sp.]MBL6892839.1 hypothetical protein [Poseidonia sp.]